MIITSRADQLDLLRTVLEERYAQHTRRLTELIARSRRASDTGADTGALAAQVADSRQELADVARALRYMAEGRYGVCETCGGEIPVQRLRDLPQARFCVPCQVR